PWARSPGGRGRGVAGASFNSPNDVVADADGAIWFTTRAMVTSSAFARSRNGGHLAGERLFAVVTPGFPDGLKVDSEGRVYSSSFSGVQVFSRAGDLIGEIALPGAVNFTFGGPRRNVLFITSDTAVWAAVLNAKGA